MVEKKKPAHEVILEYIGAMVKRYEEYSREYVHGGRNKGPCASSERMDRLEMKLDACCYLLERIFLSEEERKIVLQKLSEYYPRLVELDPWKGKAKFDFVGAVSNGMKNAIDSLSETI